MLAHRIAATVSENGTLTLENLPFCVGEKVEVIVLSEDVLENKSKTGAELVAYWQSEGLIGTRHDISNSASYARNLRQQAERRELQP